MKERIQKLLAAHPDEAKALFDAINLLTTEERDRGIHQAVWIVGGPHEVLDALLERIED